MSYPTYPVSRPCYYKPPNDSYYKDPLHRRVSQATRSIYHHYGNKHITNAFYEKLAERAVTPKAQKHLFTTEINDDLDKLLAEIAKIKPDSPLLICQKNYETPPNTLHLDKRPSTPNTKRNKKPYGFFNPRNFKTTICRFFQNNNCRYGDNCFYAHGIKDLRSKR